ncbi:MAG: hypothetical protein IT536_18485 [Hyphomicrobiales bacterium]|nr:hypothetical protein [Hyphomicrobiales bacterium]
MTSVHGAIVGAICVIATVSPSQAEPKPDSYGSDITLTVAADVGGGYDIYARTIAPYLSRHLKGNPNVVVQNLPGVGGVRMANHLFNEARKDGSVIGLTLSAVVLSQLMRPTQVRYDAGKFVWIGTIEAQTNVLSVWSARSPVKSIEEAKKTEAVIGTTNPDSFLYQEPALMNALLDTRFKLVKGYKGVNDLRLAMERGEIDGHVSPWSSWKSDRPNWLTEGRLIHIVRTGAPADDLPGVPHFASLVHGSRNKSLVELLDMSSVLGRSIAAPPGVPHDKVRMLRIALAAATADPSFLKDMASKKLPVSYRSGEDLQAYVAAALRTSPSVVLEFTKLVVGK